MWKKEFTLGREQLRAYLAGRQQDGKLNAGNTIYIPPGLTDIRTGDELTPFLPDSKQEEVTAAVQRSQTGACVIIAERITAILPPFPVEQPLIFQGIDLSLLENMISRDYLTGIVLVRLGAYAVGVCRGETLVSSKVGTGLVHSRHRQGGSSANRFRRHREKQVETFLTRACGHIREHLGPFTDIFDYVIFGGARTTIELLEKECPILTKLRGRRLAPLLEIPEPRQYVLEETVKRMWSSRVVEFGEEEAP